MSQTHQQKVAKQIMIDPEIFRTHFPEHPIPDLSYLSGCLDLDDCSEFLRGKSWTQLCEEADVIHGCFCIPYLDEADIVYYLPFFLVHFSRNSSNDVYCGHHLTCCFNKIFEQLTQEQSELVTSTIAAILEQEAKATLDFDLFLLQYAPLIGAWFGGRRSDD